MIGGVKQYQADLLRSHLFEMTPLYFQAMFSSTKPRAPQLLYHGAIHPTTQTTSISAIHVAKDTADRQIWPNTLGTTRQSTSVSTCVTYVNNASSS